MNNKAFFKYIFALLLFGSNGIVASFIDLSSQNIVLLRTLIGSILLIAIFFISGGKLTFYKNKKQFLFLAVSGIAMGTSWMFLYEAYTRIGVSIASLLYYCGPVIVMALSPLLFKEKLTANKVLGFLAVVIGVILINGNVFATVYAEKWKKHKVGQMLSHGMKQSPYIIIDNTNGASDRFIRQAIFARLNTSQGSIKEVWLYEKGKLRLLFIKN